MIRWEGSAKKWEKVTNKRIEKRAEDPHPRNWYGYFGTTCQKSSKMQTSLQWFMNKQTKCDQVRYSGHTVQCCIFARCEHRWLKCTFVVTCGGGQWLLPLSRFLNFLVVSEVCCLTPMQTCFARSGFLNVSKFLLVFSYQCVFVISAVFLMISSLQACSILCKQSNVGPWSRQ